MSFPRTILQGPRAKARRFVLLALACSAVTITAHAAHGQAFRYQAKPRAELGALAGGAVDPAPRMMEPSEEIGHPLPRRRYLDPRYRALAREQGPRPSYRLASRQPDSRVVPRDVPADAPRGAPSTGGQYFVQPEGAERWIEGPAEGGVRSEAPLVENAADWPYIENPSAAGDCGQCGTCPDCGGYGPCAAQQSYFGPTWDWSQWGVWNTSLWRNFTTFSGAQGFKGPVDRGVNGNFGFNKGVNTAVPLIDSAGVGFQFGATLALSDFEGAAGLVNHARTQIFVTGGVFQRAQYNEGFQGGAVVDYVYDDFYVSMNLAQLRAEVSYLWGFHEIGVWAAAHLNSDTANAPPAFGVPTVTWQVNNQYNLYYRANFSYGAVGRMWVGLTDFGDVLFGGDATAPLSERWAIQVAQNYLLPRNDSNVPGAVKESWGLTIAMVWYPMAKTRNACFDPYRPLFVVGDNTWLFTKEK